MSELFGWIVTGGDATQGSRGSGEMVATVQTGGGGSVRLRVKADGSFEIHVGDVGAVEGHVVLAGNVNPGSRRVAPVRGGDRAENGRANS